MLPEEDVATCAIAWAVVLFPAGVYGVYGIVQAFRRRRGLAVTVGLWSILPAALFYIAFCAETLLEQRPRSASNFALLVFSGIFPLASGCWAILLAYLIPEKPPTDDPP
jgi:hypothetical protein